MKIITKAHRQFLITLYDAHVEFMLIGGYAVIYHGYPRFTSDMDIWLKPDNENKKKVLSALRSYKITAEHIEKVNEFDFTKGHSFYVGENKNRIDFITHIVGVTYNEADIKKVFLNIDGKKIPVIPFEHLILNKILAGRPQDKADVDMLRKIKKAKD